MEVDELSNVNQTLVDKHFSVKLTIELLSVRRTISTFFLSSRQLDITLSSTRKTIVATTSKFAVK